MQHQQQAHFFDQFKHNNRMQASKNPAQDWATICNMRTTLLHLQFLHHSLLHQTETQARNFNLHTKDRLLQLHALHHQASELGSKNFKILLIAKLESVLAVYEQMDDRIWENLNNFMGYVKEIEEEMGRDVCKLYIGDKVMLDLGACERELLQIEDRIAGFISGNKETLTGYNRNLSQIEELKAIWSKYMEEVKGLVGPGMKASYMSYLKQRLDKKGEKLEESITKLKQFIA